MQPGACTALTEAGSAYREQTGISVGGTFGASGLLRERIEMGEPAEVFASANMEHPQALERAGRAGPVKLFASPQPPKGRNLYAMLAGEGKADVFLLYCTAAAEARRENPSLRVVAIPGPLAVGADYGLTVIKGAGTEAQRFADFVLSPTGQAILVRHGFAPGESR